MRKVLFIVLATIVFGGLLALESPGPAGAQDTPSPEPPSFADSGALPEDLQDAAFDRYVDLRQLGEAISESNASLAADVALQLAEGERVLLRSHKAISAKDALQLAVKLAAEKRDKASLQRLSDYAKRGGDQALAQQISQAQALAGAKRAIDPIFQVAADSITVEQFALLQRIARALETARLTGSGSELKGLMEEVKGANADVLPESRKPALLKRLEAAWADVGKAAPPSEEAKKLTDVLDKLDALARAQPPPLWVKHKNLLPRYTAWSLERDADATITYLKGFGVTGYKRNYSRDAKPWRVYVQRESERRRAYKSYDHAVRDDDAYRLRYLGFGTCTDAAPQWQYLTTSPSVVDADWNTVTRPPPG